MDAADKEFLIESIDNKNDKAGGTYRRLFFVNQIFTVL